MIKYISNKYKYNFSTIIAWGRNCVSQKDMPNENMRSTHFFLLDDGTCLGFRFAEHIVCRKSVTLCTDLWFMWYVCTCGFFSLSNRIIEMPSNTYKSHVFSAIYHKQFLCINNHSSRVEMCSNVC